MIARFGDATICTAAITPAGFPTMGLWMRGLRSRGAAGSISLCTLSTEGAAITPLQMSAIGSK
jgi:hypothetical protein